MTTTTSDLARCRRAQRETARSAFRPPPRLTVTQWADAYRFLSPESSAEPGKYASSRAPYQREPSDALSDPRVEHVVLMWPSQVGKTELLNNFLGSRVHLAPGPMLVLQPTLKMAEAWSKDRLAPMLRDTPVLRGKVRDARSRDADNTILHKKFPGGHLTIVGANAPADLASRPIRDVLCDEVDRYPDSAGTEGDPIGLAFRRTTTFRGKKLLISTPTVRGQSRIEKEYESSSKAKWWVPCPHCGEFQILAWGGPNLPFGIKWDGADATTAHYVCAHCACVIEEMHKHAMNQRGEWRHEDPANPTKGFWMNALVSPWASWRSLVAEWIKVRKDPIRLRQFINTVLCETWEDDAVRLDDDALSDPARHFTELPADVVALTRSVDVQGDRVETSVWAWGGTREAITRWLVDWQLLPGDPGTNAPWLLLDREMQKTYAIAGAAKLVLWPALTFVDSGGLSTQAVYDYCRERQRNGVYAIKGSSEPTAALVGPPKLNDSARVIMYQVGTNAGKDDLLASVGVKEPGAGYLYLPAWLEEEQRRQLSAEQRVMRYVGRKLTAVWVLREGRRNEMLDLFVYARAALQRLINVGDVRFPVGASKAAESGEPAPVPVEEPSKTVAQERVQSLAQRVIHGPPRRGWTNGWK